MKGKVCKKCLETKPITGFYKHTQNRDYRLGSCKECTKRRIKEARLDPRYREKILQYDRERQKLPRRRKMAQACKAKRKIKNLKKVKSQVAFWNARRRGKVVAGPCWVCGTTKKIHGHHYDYDLPYEVIWLCVEHHLDVHRQIREHQIDL